MPASFLTLCSGDLDAYHAQLKQFEAVQHWLASSGPSYGLHPVLAELDDIGLEMLEGVLPVELKPTDGSIPISPPPTLDLPRLTIKLSSSPGLQKTVKNFLAFASQPALFKSKRSPHGELSYRSEQGKKVFRIEKGFISQMGDVTRGDGSGGESIFGPTFNDEKEGLKVPFQLATVAMANSGKNSNSSQFFITLTSAPAQLTKLTGKYVAFGQIDMDVPSHRETLERLSELADGKGATKEKVWIGDCGVLEG